MSTGPISTEWTVLQFSFAFLVCRRGWLVLPGTFLGWLENASSDPMGLDCHLQAWGDFLSLPQWMVYSVWEALHRASHEWLRRSSCLLQNFLPDASFDLFTAS